MLAVHVGSDPRTVLSIHASPICVRQWEPVVRKTSTARTQLCKSGSCGTSIKYRAISEILSLCSWAGCQSANRLPLPDERLSRSLRFAETLRPWPRSGSQL
jgi:hypothetical protein